MNISLEQRTTTANKMKARLFVSIHLNAATATAKGFESYIYTNTSEATISFQNVLHKEIMKSIGNIITDRGKKRKNLHVLRDSAITPYTLKIDLFESQQLQTIKK